MSLTFPFIRCACIARDLQRVLDLLNLVLEPAASTECHRWLLQQRETSPRVVAAEDRRRGVSHLHRQLPADYRRLRTGHGPYLAGRDLLRRGGVPLAFAERQLGRLRRDERQVRTSLPLPSLRRKEDSCGGQSQATTIAHGDTGCRKSRTSLGQFRSSRTRFVDARGSSEVTAGLWTCVHALAASVERCKVNLRV